MRTFIIYSKHDVALRPLADMQAETAAQALANWREIVGPSPRGFVCLPLMSPTADHAFDHKE